MEDTSVFALSGFQYIIMAVVVTQGYPHKKPIYHNGKSSEITIRICTGGAFGGPDCCSVVWTLEHLNCVTFKHCQTKSSKSNWNLCLSVFLHADYAQLQVKAPTDSVPHEK